MIAPSQEARIPQQGVTVPGEFALPCLLVAGITLDSAYHVLRDGSLPGS